MAHRVTGSRFALGAVLLSALALDAGLAGAGSAAPGDPDPAPGTTSVTKLLTYDCVFGDSTEKHRISTAITTTAPTWVRAGKSVQLGELATEFTLADETRQAIAGLGAVASVEGDGTLGLVARMGKKETALPVDLPWTSTPLPETGPLALTATAPAPPAGTGAAGEMEFAVNAPALTLSPRQADGTPVLAADLAITCTAVADTDPVLVKVPVLAPGAEPPADPNTPQPGEAPGQTPGSPNGPMSAQDLAAAAARAINYVTPQGVSGKSKVVKLNASMNIGPGMAPNVSTLTVGVGLPGQMYADTALPNSQSSFYAYGFMPTSGTVEFLAPGDPGAKFTSLTGTVHVGVLEIMRTETILKLSNVLVNGVPLDVGPNCRTASPVKLAMGSVKGGTYTVFGGGPVGTIPDSPNEELRGFTIPPFTGCGVTESLDPLITGLVSGPGNQIDLLLKPIAAAPPAN